MLPPLSLLLILLPLSPSACSHLVLQGETPLPLLQPDWHNRHVCKLKAARSVRHTHTNTHTYTRRGAIPPLWRSTCDFSLLPKQKKDRGCSTATRAALFWRDKDLAEDPDKVSDVGDVRAELCCMGPGWCTWGEMLMPPCALKLSLLCIPWRLWVQ